jgi:Fur family peroxide stress response transcriptional regulator
LTIEIRIITNSRHGVVVKRARLQREMIAAFAASGRRITPRRRAILGCVAGRSDHPSARQIHRDLSSRLPRPSLATVHNTLTALVARGLIREVDFEATDDRCDTDLAPHINLACVCCGSIGDVDHDLPVPPAAIRSGLGFEAVGFRIEYRGLCTRSQVSRSTEPGARR